MAAAPVDVSSLRLDEKEFIGVLGELMAVAQQLQNNPGAGLIPKEELAADIIIKFLAPHTQPHGPLRVRKLTYKANRSNVIIEFPSQDNKEKKVVSFVGSHMDVVAASPETWSVNPFTLTVDGDKISGRGVTDCLGHCALMACLFKTLAVKKPSLSLDVWAVLIANEEAATELGVGIDEMVKQGELAPLKNGPLVWLDSADFGPTMATGGAMMWEIACSGKLFHSGFPHKTVNALELAMEVVKHVQDCFYRDFPAHPEEKAYKFDAPSSLKPTQMKTPANSVNQIPGECIACGDIRLTPWYTVDEVKAKVESYVAELDVNSLPTRGSSRFEVKEPALKGKATLKWIGAPYKGVACNINSAGFQALNKAVQTVRGSSSPFSLTGSLPIIKDLQDAGFDVQITGFGRMSAYHANDEFASLAEFGQGFRICCELMKDLDAQFRAARK